MQHDLGIYLGRHSRRLRVDTLVRLRWLAVLGQTLAVFVTHFALGFPLPLGLCLVVIAASTWLNVGLRLKFGRSDRFQEAPAAFMLAYDVVQLSALLFLTGGIENPFSLLFLAPVMISAASLTGRSTLYLTLLMVVAASTLTFFHYPLPWFPGESFTLPFFYDVGIWTAIVVGAGFVTVYASRVSEESRKLADALAATELVIAREQHLTQLDGLAAAAAHELGTPLATITLVAKDLQKQLAADPVFSEDVLLLSQEVGRCRNILSKLTSLGEDTSGIFGEMSLRLLLEEVVGPQRDFGVAIKITCESAGAEPISQRNPGLIYGLGNLIENAIDFAASEVLILGQWTNTMVKVTIEDNGPGFSPDVMAHLGEPYVTTKNDRRAKVEEGSGLGLGLFIAKTLLERSGARVEMENLALPRTGARITIRWQRLISEHGQRPALSEAWR
jgi:two-component system sensor histidine kinase RegB